MKKALVIWFFVAALVAMSCSPPADDIDSVRGVTDPRDSDTYVQVWDSYDLDAVWNNLNADLVLSVEALQTEGWSGTVYIRSDGSIDPPDAPIITSDNITYYLTGDISSPGHGIIVERSDITIEGEDFRVLGQMQFDWRGVDLSGVTNVTIRNIRVESFWGGIYADGSPNGTISDCTVLNNYRGIHLRMGSHNYEVTGCNISSNIFTGLHPYLSNDHVIRDNTITHNRWGLVFDTSHYNVLTNNTMIKDGIIVNGMGTHKSVTSMDETNTVNGKPVYFWKDRDGGKVPEGAGFIWLINCHNVEISDQDVSETDLGILLHHSTNNVISSVTAESNDFAGIWILWSDSNTVTNSVFENNAWYGIYLWGAKHNVIHANTILANRWYGLRASYYSQDNIVYHNNFIDNNTPAFVTDYMANIWDDGYPSGGNYWSNYTGVDLHSGPGQNEPGSDGIGDTPYIIDGNNSDRYPLMQPFDVTVEYDLTISRTDGGSVTEPGEGTFAYEDGTVVDLVATPAMGHHFVNWTGDVSTIVAVNSTTTTITMNGDYSIVANFEAVEGGQTQCTATATGTGTACVTTSHGLIEDLQAVPPHSLPSVLFPHGMFNFRITDLTLGQTVTLTIEFPSPLPIGTLWWKYDNGRWYGLPNESDNGDNIMVISLTDGGVHDLDDVPGQITDPGGPGDPMTVGWDGQPINKTAVVVPWVGLLAAIVAGVSLLMLRRRREQEGI